MNSNYIEKRLVEQYKLESFTRNDLLNFFRHFDPDINEGTLGWKIFDLKRKNIIYSVKKGIFKIAAKKEFRPEPDKNILAIGKIMQNSFDHHIYNIWTTAWLNGLIELQAVSFITILETDRESIESVFFNLKTKGYKDIFLKPDESVIGNYVSELADSIVIKPMVSRAPVIKIKKIILPSLEKILVDLYCDDTVFFSFQGSQLAKIYEAAIDKYHINYSKLLNYARRRKRETALKEFLAANLYDKIKDIFE